MPFQLHSEWTFFQNMHLQKKLMVQHGRYASVEINQKLLYGTFLKLDLSKSIVAAV